jgi:D-amino-acid dehydrogenase
MVQMQEAAQQCEHKQQGLDTAAMRTLEPAFPPRPRWRARSTIPMTLPAIAYFAKQMRNAAQQLGVSFHFDATVTAIRAEFGGRVALEVRSPQLSRH